jgi:16S rRNA processing protein RimM
MNLSEIGYFSKTHGIKGHLILKSEIDFNIENLTALFVDASGGKAPYFISEISEVKNDLRILLEEIDTVEKARSLVGKKVLINSDLVIEEESEDLRGYELIEKKFGSLGKITGVTDNGAQILVSIIYKGKEVILPLVEELIESLDEKERKIVYNAPEGLIEMYLK